MATVDVDKTLKEASDAIKNLRKFALASPDPKEIMECQRKITELATKIFEIDNKKLKKNSNVYGELITRLDGSASKLKGLKAGIDKTTRALSAASQLLTALTRITKALG